MRGSYSSGVVWPAPRPAAARVLLCFSYCGGGTAPMRPWIHAVPDDVDLGLVCLPGRERRIAEPPAQTWDDLMRAALTAVRTVASRPYILFGHSAGARVAFESAVHIQHSGGPAPQALVVSASNAPSLAARDRERPPTSRTSDAALLAWMRDVGQLPAAIVDDPELRQMALDLFRADKRALESYEYIDGRTVTCPVRRLYAADDPHVDLDDAAWSTLAAGPYSADLLPGGHFYTPQTWATLPHHMRL